MESFWQQTPKTLRFALAAHARRQIREQNRDRILAYHIAGMQRQRRLKEPKLLREPGRKQTWQEQFEIAKRWVADAEKQQQLREKINGR